LTIRYCTNQDFSQLAHKIARTQVTCGTKKSRHCYSMFVYTVGGKCWCGHAHFSCLCHSLMCDTAGVMYWGDASFDVIETSDLDGNGRRILLNETSAHYFAFALHEGSIYFTDWLKVYVLPAQRYASVTLAMSLCLCVCLSVYLSQAGTVGLLTLARWLGPLS